MASCKKGARLMHAEDEGSSVIPGLPADVAKLCLAKLPLPAVARSRVVCRAWNSALRDYPAAAADRLPHSVTCFFRGHKHDWFFTWLLLSRSDLRTHLITSFFLRAAQETDINICTSKMQVIPTGTPMLLVRATLCFGTHTDESDENGGFEEGHHHVCGAGFLQGFDLWRMRWLTPREIPWSPMPVDRWKFAAGHVGKHVYFAGGDGPRAPDSAERLSLETWRWELLPRMHKERRFQPSGFAMNGRFFVVGGESHSMTSTRPQSGEFYDPITRVWTLVPDMWPHELWWAGGAPQSITVVNDVAYAIDVLSQEVLRLKVEDEPRFRVLEWQAAGKLPWVHRSILSLQSLVSEGRNELWAVLIHDGIGDDREWLVFSCTPHLTQQGLAWECLHFDVPSSHQRTLSAGIGVSV